MSTPLKHRCYKCGTGKFPAGCRERVKNLRPLPCEGEGFCTEDYADDQHMTYSEAARQHGVTVTQMRSLVLRNDVERVNAYFMPETDPGEHSGWSTVLRRADVERTLTRGR